MSHKQAKRLRREQRAAGITPRLDQKRMARQAALDAENVRIEEEGRLQREDPEEYERQKQELKRRANRSGLALLAAVSAVGGGLPRSGAVG